MKMNLSAKGRKLLGAFGLGRSDRGERRVTDPDGGSAQCAATLGVGFSKSDQIMNTKTNTLWCRSLAMLALTFALAGTALGQIQVQWSNPADINYGTILDATQLNATATDAAGNAVAGVFKYSWDAPVPPQGARDGEDDPATDGVKIGTRELTLADILAADADSTVDGTQANPDWRYLDVGNAQNLRVTFTPNGLVQVFPKVVQIDVNPKPLTIFPRALERDYGEENYPGWENGKNPLYPGTQNPIRDGQNQLLTNAAPGVVINRSANPAGPIVIASQDPDAAGGYSRTGDALFFDGFVRGEDYTKLAGADQSVAALGEVLVTTFFRLDVKDGNGAEIFRGAPVGTAGTVTFAANPAFKNYSVSIGGSGSLTVKKALIKFEGAIRDGGGGNGPKKTYGDALALTTANAFKTTNLTLSNDFRLGEEEIKNFITTSSSGAAATANVGSYSITLTETPPATFDVSILRNNYDFQLVPGTLVVQPREVHFTGIPSNPPAGFDAANTSGFNFKLYGDSAQAPTAYVTGLAPHHRIDNAVEYDDPRDAAGAIPGAYAFSQVKAEAFSSFPTAAHTAAIESLPGTYAITVSGGDGGGNYTIKTRNNGTFTVGRAYLVIQVGNASSIINQNQATAPLSLFGVRTFDQVLNSDGSLNVDATLDKVLVPGTPKPARGVVGFNNNPGGGFPAFSVIQFTNRDKVRASNYDVYFNDGLGSHNFLITNADGTLNNTPVAIDSVGAVSGAQKGFSNFLANVFNSTKDPGGFDATGGTNNGVLLSHALFVVGDGTIGRYTVDVIRPTVSWNPPSTAAFGTNTSDSNLNAVILNPDTGLALDDNRNVPQLLRNADYLLQYTLTPKDGAEVIIKADAGFGAVVANPLDQARLLPAGKTHKLTVKMLLTAAGQAKVTAANRQLDQFRAADASRDLTVFARTITVTPRQTGADEGKAARIFSAAIPSRSFADAFWDATYSGAGDLTAAQRDAEIKFDDVKVDVLDASGNAIAAGTTTTARGAYVLRISGLAAQNGNVAFSVVNGTFTVSPIPVVIAWENNLPSIEYGAKVPVAGVKDATITTGGVPSDQGSIVYTPDPEASDIFPDVPGQAIKAKWVPNDAATSNYAVSNEIARTVSVSKKPISVIVQSIDKTFGDDTPARSLSTGIDSLLAAKDAGQVTVSFNVAGDGASNKGAVGEYAITPTFGDTGNRLANYAVTITSSRVKISKRAATVTPVSRSMEVGQNATDFVDDWEGIAGRKANEIVIFSGLASFHTIGDDRAKLNARFPTLELGTDSTSLPPVGTTANIRVDVLGATGGLVDGARIDATNYDYTSVNNSATLSVVEQKAQLTFAASTIMYGQKIGRTGAAPGSGDANNGTRLADVKVLNATSTTTLDGAIVYTFKEAVTITRPSAQSFAAGDVIPDGLILPAGAYKINATANPAASETNFASNSKEITLTVLARPLTIAIQDRTNTYGDLDLFFQAEYGIRNGGVLNTNNQLVNGDTATSLNRQLVLFSNASATSGAGDYYIAVAQSASDANYAINLVEGTQDLFDGQVKDANGVILVNVGTNFVPNGQAGTGVAFGFVGSGATLESNAGKFTVNKAPLTIAAGDLTKDQGQVNPGFVAVTPDTTQLKNGDTLETLLATPVRFSTSVNTTTVPGEYDIFSFGGSSANYVVTHVNGKFTVLATPAPIGWNPNPTSLVYGTALGADQLNASSTVAGTFDYSVNAAGTVFGAGTQALMTTFTPTDLTANRVTTATASIEITPAPLAVTAGDISRSFTEVNTDFTVSFGGFVNGDGPGVITSPITFVTDGVDGANAGDYPLTPAGGAAANYALNFIAGTITIGKESATITLGDLSQVANGTPRIPTVTTVPADVAVETTFNGSTDAPIETGTYEVTVLSVDPNYEGFAIGTLTITGTGDVSITNLDQVFDGSPKPATISTSPIGLNATVTYNGSADAPVNAGTYQISVLITDPVHSGFGLEVLTIQPATAEVTLDPASLDQPVNGITGAVVTTVPAGLNVEVFYGDVTSLPTEIGSSLIRAVVNDPNWVGSAEGTFSVGRSTQEITTFALPAFTMAGSPLSVGLAATANSGLPVSFAVSSGSATANGNLLTVTQPGDIIVVASQAGDDLFAPAETTFTVTVTGEGVPAAPEVAPQVSFAGLSAEGIELSISGAAGATVSVMGTRTLPGGTFSPVATVTLDASGNGSLTLPTSGEASYFKAANQ
ncbi:MBG domain-containing protein [Verrucomicrobia bacterium]|nr:MBG domain-containing protein [Verrucomicrobiota bacterium]